tara:strand:+ start:86 stop:247 length:162 start_codon:yes stop_codon:yes gene_type:complete
VFYNLKNKNILTIKKTKTKWEMHARTAKPVEVMMAKTERSLLMKNSSIQHKEP